jgi:hypothetical protein
MVAAGGIHDGGRFAQFLEVSRPIERDRDLETFLWYLDGGWRGTSISDTKRVLRDRDRFLTAMASKPDTRSELRHSVVGFAKFLTFCQAFERLLDGTEDPILRSGFWYYHAYWFKLSAEQLQEQLDAGIQCFADWESSDGERRGAETSSSSRKPASDRNRMRRTVRRLTSGEFGWALDEVRGQGSGPAPTPDLVDVFILLDERPTPQLVKRSSAEPA